jgi:protoporphyrinogen/coproporphyrinogen III oxidase
MDEPPVSHVLSTLPIPALDQLMLRHARRAAPERTHILPHADPDARTFPYASTVLVRLVFPPTADAFSLPLHPPGAGFLVPRPLAGYADRRAAGILGVAFDSSVASAQDYELRDDGDEGSARGAYGSSRFTKMTAVLGGPFPLTPAQVEPAAVVQRLSEYLGRELPKPTLARVHVCPRCVPAYVVGHARRIGDVHAAVRDSKLKLAIAGAGVMGADVDTCVAVARGAALGAWLDG